MLISEKKPAAGFFIEGFTAINSGVSTTYYDNNGNITNKDRFTDLALGFGLGSKWIHKKGFLFEINAGIGRNLFNNDSFEIIPRGGITFGYRFN